MDFKIPKGVDGIGTVLPYISNNVIELSSLEIVYWIRWKPILHIDVTDFAMLPV